jgi:hypothetical protein
MSDKLSWIFDMSDIGPFTKYHFVNKQVLLNANSAIFQLYHGEK